MTLAMLCDAAGVPCKATGRWIERLVEVVVPTDVLIPRIDAEPGSLGAVRITTPPSLNPLQAARYSLAAMAYGMFDLVARESIRGAAWARPTVPSGRKRSGVAKSNAARQRAFRLRKIPQDMS